MDDNSYKDFVDRIDSICTQYANKTAITYLQNNGSKTIYTFEELYKRVRTAKVQFADIGMLPGDRAAIVAPQSPFVFYTVIALAYANITSVLIDSSLPVEEIERLLAISDVRAIFTVPGILSESSISTSEVFTFDISKKSIKYDAFDESVNVVSSKKTSDPATDVIAILFSSGTTSSAKGVMIKYAAALETVGKVAYLANIKDDSAFLVVLPMTHIAGFDASLTVLRGGCIGMIEDVDATKLQKGFMEYNPTHFAMVPRVYEIMEKKIRQEIMSKGKLIEFIVNTLLILSGALRKYLNIQLGRSMFKGIRKKVFGERIYFLGVGGGICDKATAKFFVDLGIEIWTNFYALTETNIPTVATGIFDRYPVGTEGNIKRFNDIDIKIHNPDENGLGEVRVKTSLIMKGYFRDPELTLAAFDGDGFFKTGDFGYLDSKGFLHITGRIKEAILMHTGKKVAPSDVDALYGKLCPEVRIASCGVQRKNKTYDEVHLFIEKGELTPDKQQELQKSIIEFSAQTSTLYQISKVHFIDKIPTTSVGKVKRFLLQEAALDQ